MGLAQAKTDRPNIIFILADDLGYGDISCFNAAGKISTPNVDKIARAGVMFTDAHTSAAVCTPTRYGLLTGRYNWRSSLKMGVLGMYNPPLMSAARTNMASMLKRQGYQTACIGKWHLGWNWPTTDGKAPVDKADAFNLDFSKPITGGPADLGFDYFFGMDAPNYAPYCFIENRHTVGLPDYYYATHPFGDCRPGRGVPGWHMENIMGAVQQKAVDYIGKASTNGSPFFLYLPLPAPHTPIAPSEKFRDRSGLNAYADFVLEVDYLVGAIHQALEQHGQLQNTLLVFTSDNGCSPQADFKWLAEKGHHPSGPFRGTKADLYEGGHRVPLVLQWPSVITKPHTVAQTVCLNDFMATVAGITGYTLTDSEAEDSYNLLPAITKPGYSLDIREATVHHSIHGSFAIRKGDWKLLLAAGSGGWSAPRPGNEEKGLPPVQLYNLKNDPGEKMNLQEKYPERVTELTALLRKYIADGRSTPGKPRQNDGEYPWKQVAEILKP